MTSIPDKHNSHSLASSSPLADMAGALNPPNLAAPATNSRHTGRETFPSRDIGAAAFSRASGALGSGTGRMALLESEQRPAPDFWTPWTVTRPSFCAEGGKR